MPIRRTIVICVGISGLLAALGVATPAVALASPTHHFASRFGRILPRDGPVGDTPELVDDGPEIMDGQTFDFVPVSFPAPTEFVTNNVEPSTNWSGYVGNGTGLVYKEASEKWTEPHYADSSERRDVSIWAGVGSGSDDAHTLAQAGVQTTTTSSSVSRTWWYEFYPELPEQPVAGLGITGGDTVESFVNIYAEGSSGFEMEVKFYNLTDSTYTHFDVGETGQAGTQADAILERPTFSDGLHPLTELGTVNSSTVFNLQGEGGQCIGANPNTRYDMSDAAGEPLVNASWTDTNGCDWQDVRTGNQ